jgi:putative flippase GtrA
MYQTIEQLLIRRPVILQLLRFAAIGVLNTAIDFIVLNFVSKTLGITSGTQLGTINIIGVIVALIQSYYWNRYWTFGFGQTTDLVKNFFRLVAVGLIGVIGFVAVLIGVNFGALPIYYLFILIAFVIAEIVAWIMFGLHKTDTPSANHQFLTFLVVSAVGVLINSSLIAVVSGYLATGAYFSNPDLAKNIAKVAATAVSLIWNFVGYKLIVFRNK